MWLSQWNNIMRSHQVNEPLPDEVDARTLTARAPHPPLPQHHPKKKKNAHDNLLTTSLCTMANS